jgi:hypothetical protein
MTMNEKRERFMEMVHEEIGEDHKLSPVIAALVAMVEDDARFNELYEIHEGIEKYGQFLTEKEARKIVDGFVSYDGTRGAKWQPTVLFQAVKDLGGHISQDGEYNCWTIYVLMNWLHSDYGRTLMKRVQGNDYALMIYEMSLDWINDRDGDHDVREKFL